MTTDYHNKYNNSGKAQNIAELSKCDTETQSGQMLLKIMVPKTYSKLGCHKSSICEKCNICKIQ